MAQSIFTGYSGPFVPLGLIVIASPGQIKRFTSLIDPASNNAPETPTPAFSANNTGAAVPVAEYTVRFQQILVQGVTKNGTTGVKNNTGFVYVMMKGNLGPGDNTDYGAMILAVGPGLTGALASAPLNMNVFNPYSLYLTADTANDGALITGIQQ